MPRKVTDNPSAAKPHDQPTAATHLFDLRTLVVLVLACGAGWLTYQEGGWTPALTVGVAVTVALHALLRNSRT
jgi:membrane protein YdbS with pleckstrin-like domain